jgi:hypothetical protein
MMTQLTVPMQARLPGMHQQALLVALNHALKFTAPI